MKFQVHITEDAEQDLDGIYSYVAHNDSESKADSLLLSIEEVCFSISDFPRRGHVPPELEKLSIFNYLEVHFKPYRIIYQTISSRVYIHCIVDGRRDLIELLHKRLLR